MYLIDVGGKLIHRKERIVNPWIKFIPLMNIDDGNSRLDQSFNGHGTGLGIALLIITLFPVGWVQRLDRGNEQSELEIQFLAWS